MMTDHQPGHSAIDRGSSVLMWDMAGTLIPFDPVSGRPQPLPGAADFLPELGRIFRQVVTTGDETANARKLLRDFELLDHFEEVCGDLFHPLGKPYGAILKHLKAEADCSLVIGDRLRADLPADTADLVTILINQEGETCGAGVISFIVHLLRKQNAPTFTDAFDKLVVGATPDSGREGPLSGGIIEQAHLRHDGFAYKLWTFQLDDLGPRRIIVI